MRQGAIRLRGLKSNILTQYRLTDEEKKVQHFAHVSVIFGTLIWGFGDIVPLIANS